MEDFYQGIYEAYWNFVWFAMCHIMWNNSQFQCFTLWLCQNRVYELIDGRQHWVMAKRSKHISFKYLRSVCLHYINESVWKRLTVGENAFWNDREGKKLELPRVLCCSSIKVHVRSSHVCRKFLHFRAVHWK